jgi:hypothetical protein
MRGTRAWVAGLGGEKGSGTAALKMQKAELARDLASPPVGARTRELQQGLLRHSWINVTYESQWGKTAQMATRW